MAEKANKSYRVLSVVGSSFIKRLSNADHAHFMMEFLNLMPQGLYDNKMAALTQKVADEVENINNCRKNHNRERYNSRLASLKSLMSALYRILVSAAKDGVSGAAIEVHSYERRVQPEVKNKGYFEAVRAYLFAWSGTGSTAAEALVDEAKDLCEEIESLMAFMMMEDSMIKNLEAQIVYRESTDEFVFNIIAKASVESYELSPLVENEKPRIELVNSFLEAWLGFVERIRISVKNSGTDPEVEPVSTATVKDHNFPEAASDANSANAQKMSRSIQNIVLDNIKSESDSEQSESEPDSVEDVSAKYQKIRAQKLDAYKLANQVTENVKAKYGENLTDEELEKYSQEEYALLTATDEQE